MPKLSIIYGRHLPKSTFNVGQNLMTTLPREEKGNITGGQQILLNSATGSKADIDVPKKSFGRISGSFVDLGNCWYKHNDSSNSNVSNGVEDKDNNLRCDLETNLTAKTINKTANKITIIAEGLETALSVKQALGSDVIYSNKSRQRHLYFPKSF